MSRRKIRVLFILFENFKGERNICNKCGWPIGTSLRYNVRVAADLFLYL